MTKLSKGFMALGLFLFFSLGVLAIHHPALPRSFSAWARFAKMKIQRLAGPKIAYDKEILLQKANVFGAEGDIFIEDEDFPRFTRAAYLATKKTLTTPLENTKAMFDSRIVSDPKVSTLIFQTVLNL